MIGRVASLGKVVKLRADIGAFAVSPTMAVLRFFGLEPSFAFQYMNSASFQEQFSSMSNGSTRQSVGMNIIRKLHIVKPELVEQKAMATILSDMDAEIDALTANLEKARRIKQGMMSELLTGRLRLIKEDTDNGKN
ncbi:MAG: restriction endonuclease subunit S [Candidatus Desulforudis sp.]|nr:restriction endonuclease subunit S [Bacillota bacterium]MBV1736322.1 restriction endonuclease subunit S [Desulforudis sp.]